MKYTNKILKVNQNKKHYTSIQCINVQKIYIIKKCIDVKNVQRYMIYIYTYDIHIFFIYTI